MTTIEAWMIVCFVCSIAMFIVGYMLGRNKMLG